MLTSYMNALSTMLTIVTSAQTDAEAKELLTLMEVPFAR